jgi:hypothetical protein
MDTGRAPLNDTHAAITSPAHAFSDYDGNGDTVTMHAQMTGVS